MNFNETEGLDLGSTSKDSHEVEKPIVPNNFNSTSDLASPRHSSSLSRLMDEAKKANPLLLGFLVLLILISLITLFRTTNRPEPPENIIEVAGPDNLTE